LAFARLGRSLASWFVMMLLLFLALPTQAREVRVGVYQNPPKLMLAEDGKISGILGDLLIEIAEREDWQLQPVACEWESCLQALAAGQIDLMPDLAYTEARAAKFDFHAVPALHSWSQLYRRADVTLESMLDLDQRRIAVLGGSVQEEYLYDLVDGFGIEVQWLVLPSMEEAIAAVVEGRADAMATNFHFGDWTATRKGLLQTGLIFLPSKLFYATGKGRNADLTSAIDAHLREWRSDSGSLYFQVLRHWGAAAPEARLPTHLRWTAAAVIVSLLLTLGVVALLRREVERKTRSLRASEVRLATILNSVDARIFIKDADLRYRYVNQKVCELFGLPEDRIIGESDESFFDAETAARIRADDQQVIEQGIRLAHEESLRLRDEDERHTAFSIKLPLRDGRGRTTELCGIATDLTEHYNLLSRLHDLANFDPLTGLPNRLQMQERLRAAITSLADDAHQGALLLLNLDRFRELNDSRGLAAGDQWLKRLAQQLRLSLPGEASMARLGPDEFAFLIPQVPRRVAEAQLQVGAFAQRLLDGVALPTELGGESYHGSGSIGITLFADGTISVEDVLKHADLALAQAKIAGGNRMRFFQPEMHAAVAARATLELELRNALEAEQFLLHFQPQFDRDSRLIGCEALLRWQHPQRGLVAPGSFIPLAEASGLILPLGAWVLRKACEQLAAWRGSAETGELRIAVNVSARQLHQPDFVEGVLAQLAACNVPGRMLELEITESLLVEDIDEAIDKLAALRSHGVRIALDDFGTGYSALNYIKRLPLDVLKIDTSFVRDLLIEPNDMAIVRTVIALGSSLGLDVLAEGVENSAQHAVLLEMGCGHFQGYLLGRPAPINALSAWLASSALA
jgi:diguanylate cyclase (GGDEF)-like protein/PAS domain S-box-containing protein